MTCYDTGHLYVSWSRPDKYQKSVDYYKVFHKSACGVFDEITIEQTPCLIWAINRLNSKSSYQKESVELLQVRPKSFLLSSVLGSFYETESEIWAGLGRVGFEYIKLYKRKLGKKIKKKKKI